MDLKSIHDSVMNPFRGIELGVTPDIHKVPIFFREHQEILSSIMLGGDGIKMPVLALQFLYMNMLGNPVKIIYSLQGFTSSMSDRDKMMQQIIDKFFPALELEIDMGSLKITTITATSVASEEVGTIYTQSANVELLVKTVPH